MSQTPPGPPPRRAARREFLRALRDLALWPARLGAFSLERDAIASAVRRDLDSPVPELLDVELPPLGPRPLRILLSCGETSGEAHAVRLIEPLRALAAEAGAPEPEFSGLGGNALRAAGVRVIGDPTSRATMGGKGVTRELSYYLKLLESCATRMRDWRPDVFVGVDAPALHVPLAHIARSYGVPVVHHIAPQYWAWAPWRVKAYKRVVDRALCIMPWESSWLARHGVGQAYVGHPQMDVLAELPAAPPDSERRTLVLLPGSRKGEIGSHLAWMLEAVRPLRATVPDLEVVVAQQRHDHAQTVLGLIAADGSPTRLEVGDLHGTLGRARCALAVSGTVLTDLLHHRVPTVVIYAAHGALGGWFGSFLLTCHWFASTNLLARDTVLPEFAFKEGSKGPLEEVGGLLVGCYNDETWRARCVQGLERAARRIGPPGAAQRAARHILDIAARRS